MSHDAQTLKSAFLGLLHRRGLETNAAVTETHTVLAETNAPVSETHPHTTRLDTVPPAIQQARDAWFRQQVKRIGEF